jgi:hypothetical protein
MPSRLQPLHTTCHAGSLLDARYLGVLRAFRGRESRTIPRSQGIFLKVARS